MSKVLVTFKRSMNDQELKELGVLIENQKTTDKYTNTSLHIDGQYAVIDVDVDDDGDITVL